MVKRILALLLVTLSLANPISVLCFAEDDITPITSETTDIEDHAHQWSEETITQEANCTNPGSKIKTCTVCGETESYSYWDSYAHVYDSGRIVDSAENDLIKKISTCTFCGKQKIEYLPKSEPGLSDVLNPSATIVYGTVHKTVTNGEIKVDGILDNQYTASMQVKINPPKYSGADTHIRATVYSLYDDNYVYVFYQVENDTTLLTADNDYIQEHPHPNRNDSVELRIGDDSEKHLSEYTGSNTTHHLFLMDAYGKRFSCYENTLENYLSLMKGASKIVSDTEYNIEMAIPVEKPFSKGDILQFNFQINDCQDFENYITGYIGLGKNYLTLVNFRLGGEIGEINETVEPEEENKEEVEETIKPDETTETEETVKPDETVEIEERLTIAFPEVSPKQKVETNNAVISLYIDEEKTGDGDISKVVLYLYDKDRNPIDSITKEVSYPATYAQKYFFDINQKLNISLLPDTEYYYLFMVYYEGNAYYTPIYSFTTKKIDASLKNFTEVNSFDEKIFPDIRNEDWYSANAKKAYLVGLMNGNEKGFDGDASITLAQVITLAARLHSIYNTGEANFVQGKVWYEVFEDYCIENCIINEGEYTDLNRPATRAEFVDILYASLPSYEFDKKNDISFIPDVTPINPYFDCIFNFYLAGILAGSDSEHNFYPERTITRAETAAILTRIIDRNLRLSFN